MDVISTVLINTNLETEITFYKILKRINGMNLLSKFERLNAITIDKIMQISPNIVFANFDEVEKGEIQTLVKYFVENNRGIPKVIDVRIFFSWINEFYNSNESIYSKNSLGVDTLDFLKSVPNFGQIEQKNRPYSKREVNGRNPAENRYFLNKRLPVRVSNKLRLLKFENIQYILASNYYAEVYTTDKKTHLVRESMTKLEKLLGSDFQRIHRSNIINLNQIDEIIFSDYSEIDVKMLDGKLLRVSKKYKKDFSNLMNL